MENRAKIWCQDGVTMWNRFPHHWPNFMGTQRSAMDSPHRSPMNSPPESANNDRLAFFLCCWPGHAVEQTIVPSVIWDAVMLFLCQGNYHLQALSFCSRKRITEWIDNHYHRDNTISVLNVDLVFISELSWKAKREINTKYAPSPMHNQSLH